MVCWISTKKNCDITHLRWLRGMTHQVLPGNFAMGTRDIQLDIPSISIQPSCGKSTMFVDNLAFTLGYTLW